MHHRSIAILAILCFAFGGGGCASKSNKDYDEVMMPLQTGSLLQRRVLVPRSDTKKKPKKKRTSAPKPEAEPAETPPTPEEESTPPPDRFR
jgi:hypothetical protein